ncbi:MAG TPA: 3-oxoadipate enol-lactonase [Candidatus Dormibacteraeota bacterium]|nr:3-oxoadipate enol-lactonase [Candidatus Dormibacteraeota bacterium]
MPFLQLPAVRIHYELSGPTNRPVLLLAHPLGVNLSIWEPQLAEFSKHFRVLRYDARGHGDSSVPPGDYSIPGLAQDALDLLDALKIDQAHFCGISMGGMAGMWLGANARSRFDKIVLSNTAVKIGTAESWSTRIESVRKMGMAAIAPSIIERWFTFEFRAGSPHIVAGVQNILEKTDPQGYMASCAAIRDMDYREKISAMQSPVLVISGSNDPGTTPADGQYIASRIPGAIYSELPASHLSNVEAAEQFTAQVLRFLTH